MKRFIRYMGKCCIAAVISLAILSLLAAVYFTPPIAIPQPDGTTNYKYVPNATWSYMLEGFGYGKTDSTGYNNAYYDDCSDPDIVFAGSSHFEALQVPEDANCVYVLNEMLDNDDSATNDYKCLNIGVSGHFFETTASNYPYIAAKYSGAKYMVIELFNAKYSSETLDQIIADQFHAPMEEKGILHTTLQRIPFIRLMYKKINETSSGQSDFAGSDGASDSAVDSASVMDEYIEKMNVILDEIADVSAEHDIVPIIVMHERFWLDSNCEIVMETDETYKNAFKECCKTNNITVIDVSSAMVKEYKEHSAFSYGFSNSAPGEGHLNETGHRILAQAVYQCIKEIEAIQ